MSVNKQDIKKMNDQYKNFDELHKNQVSYTKGIIGIAIILIIAYLLFQFL